MRGIYPRVRIKTLCLLFGKTSQAYYKARIHATQKASKHGQILTFVRAQRVHLKKMGTTKLLYLLRTEEGIQIGRDALYALLRANNLLIKRKKKYRPSTTNGNGESIYPDLRKHLKVQAINQLWSSDITYFRLIEEGRHCYATFIIDEYAHLIVGFTVALTMKATDTLVSLKMAVTNCNPPKGNKLIFHTDRGSQFKSTLFQKYLAKHEIRSSMTQDGKPSDNPVSERLNGILKHELLDGDTFDNIEQAVQLISCAVNLYNNRRPHLSCEMLTPKQAYDKGMGPMKKLWKQRKKE